MPNKQKDLKDDNSILVSYLPDLLTGIGMMAGAMRILALGFMEMEKRGVAVFIFSLVLCVFCLAVGHMVVIISMNGLEKIFSKTQGS